MWYALIFATFSIFSGLAGVVRDRMVRVGHADLRVRHAAELAARA